MFNLTFDQVPCKVGCCQVTYVVRRSSADLILMNFMLLKPSEIHQMARRSWTSGWVLDAGANIGVFSAQTCLLEPEVQILAVELDEQNYRLLVRNTGHCRRIVHVRAALWGKDAALAVKNGRGWGPPQWQYEAVEAQHGRDRGVTVETLMRRFHIEEFQLAKFDIEGAEKEVFSSPTRAQWLGRVRELMIETHEPRKPGCEAAVNESLTASGFVLADRSLDKQTW
eukprot:EG_transcript_23037